MYQTGTLSVSGDTIFKKILVEFLESSEYPKNIQG